METGNRYSAMVFVSLIIGLGLASFAFCLAAEFKRSNKKDMKIDGKFCYLPGSAAFGFGITALICLLTVQIIGNMFICRKFSSIHGRRCCKQVMKPTIASMFLVVSWISFGIAVILISAATSMNNDQPLGEGWLDGECYIVKDGVYFGSAILVLLNLGSIIGSAVLTTRRKSDEEELNVHTQLRTTKIR